MSHRIICEICGEEGPHNNKFYYKWPDASPSGDDIDGFCCEKCSKLKPWDQWKAQQISYQSSLIKQILERNEKLTEDQIKALMEQSKK